MIAANIPQVGDAVFIQSDFYTGEAVVTYINEKEIFHHHTSPIQVELDEGELHQFEDFNHGQTIRRFSLKDIMGFEQAKEPEPLPLEDNVQGTLFDF